MTGVWKFLQWRLVIGDTGVSYFDAVLKSWV